MTSPYGVLTVLLVAASIAAGGCGRSVERPTVSYVLPPEAAPRIAEMFERMKPSLRYDDVSIPGNHVIARLCPESAPSACFTLRLEHPGDDCTATHWGPFCVRFPDGEPPTAASALIAEALGVVDVGIWTRIDETGEPRGREIDPALVLRTLAISLALMAVPLLVGWLLGRLWRVVRGRESGIAIAVAALALPATAALALDGRLQWIGAWDALFVGAAAGGGLLLAMHRSLADRRNVVLLVLACAGGAAVLELASRVALPPPPAFPSSEGPQLFLPDQVFSTPARAYASTPAGILACHAIYGSAYPAPPQWGPVSPQTWQPRTDRQRRVLHLGDSMVFGSPTAGRFTDVLNEIEPDVEHVNASIAGTGPDVYLGVLRRFIAQHGFDAVVMHLTPNDFSELDALQYPCSDWKPLLLYDGPRTRLSHAEPVPYGTERNRLVWLIHNSPPPYLLRACVDFSAAASHLAAAFVYLGRRLGYGLNENEVGVLEAHLTAILRDARDELRDRRVPLIVDIFRDRGAVAAGTPTEDWAEDRMKRIAEGLGIVTVDAWEPLVPAVRQGKDLYVSATDIHFNREGHALIAAWLHAELPGAIERARAAER